MAAPLVRQAGAARAPAAPGPRCCPPGPQPAATAHPARLRSAPRMRSVPPLKGQRLTPVLLPLQSLGPKLLKDAVGTRTILTFLSGRSEVGAKLPTKFTVGHTDRKLQGDSKSGGVS